MNHTTSSIILCEIDFLIYWFYATSLSVIYICWNTDIWKHKIHTHIPQLQNIFLSKSNTSHIIHDKIQTNENTCISYSLEPPDIDKQGTKYQYNVYQTNENPGKNHTPIIPCFQYNEKNPSVTTKHSKTNSISIYAVNKHH